jgi:hypothetical protein
MGGQQFVDGFSTHVFSVNFEFDSQCQIEFFSIARQLFFHCALQRHFLAAPSLATSQRATNVSLRSDATDALLWVIRLHGQTHVHYDQHSNGPAKRSRRTRKPHRLLEGAPASSGHKKSKHRSIGYVQVEYNPIPSTVLAALYS